MITTTRRSLVGALALCSTGVATRTFARIGAADSNLDLSFVHPDLRRSAQNLIKQFGGFPEISDSNLPEMRRVINGMPLPSFKARDVSKRTIKVADNPSGLNFYIINGQSGREKPVIVYMHGGGFVFGNAISSITSLQPVAKSLNCVIVTVDYRLAPETNFTGSIEDNYAALKWVYDNADTIGVDRRRIVVMGESAGGGHAALLAIAARDRGEVPIASQILIYPMLDDRTGSLTTPPSPIGSILWTASQNRFGWQSFLGTKPGTSAVPTAGVPARQLNLKGLPPTFIGVGSIDLFVDEDIEYARRLIASDISTELVVVPGAFHGFDGSAPETSVARKFTETKLNAIRRAFA